MFEVDVVHVSRVHEFPLTHEASTPDGTVIAYECQNFGVEDLVEIGAERGVTRWAEHTADDGVDVPDEVVLIGWAESPIARDEVTKSYHDGHHGDPMVNIKVHSFELPVGEAFDALVGEFELDPRLARLDGTELRTLIDGFIEKDSEPIFNAACEDHFEFARDQATENFFAKYPNAKVFTAGRSGGWLVVTGLPEVSAWDADLLKNWHEFETFCKGVVDDIPRAMAWQVLANSQDELAGRIVRVQLTITLSDADLDKAGNDPTEWDWRDMLDLDLDSDVQIHRLDP